MFKTNNIIVLVFSMILLTFNGNCQLLSDSSSHLLKTDQNNIIYDTIKNKHTTDFLCGKEDAKEFYSDNSSFAISFFSSLIVPPIGFITTIALSTSEPKIKNLGIPDEQLLKNDQYVKGYMHKAFRMKAGRSWGGCLTGIAFFCIAYFSFY